MKPKKEHVLLDAIIEKHHLKNDAQLSRLLGVKPPVVSKIRSGALNVSDSVRLKVIENARFSIADIRRIEAR